MLGHEADKYWLCQEKRHDLIFSNVFNVSEEIFVQTYFLHLS